MLTSHGIQLVAEAKIEQAIEDGKFASLAGFGKPFEFDLERSDPNWWIKKKCKIEEVKLKFKLEQ